MFITASHMRKIQEGSHIHWARLRARDLNWAIAGGLLSAS